MTGSEGGAALLALADEIERAEGPSRELDAKIAKAVGHLPFGAFRGGAGTDPGTFATGAYSFFTCASYTTSLDAAMGLVPEGAGIKVERYWIARTDLPVWSAVLWIGNGNAFDAEDVPSAPQAVVAAALRARAAQKGEPA